MSRKSAGHYSPRLLAEMARVLLGVPDDANTARIAKETAMFLDAIDRMEIDDDARPEAPMIREKKDDR